MSATVLSPNTCRIRNAEGAEVNLGRNRNQGWNTLTDTSVRGYALQNVYCTKQELSLGKYLSLGFASNGNCTTGTIESFDGTIGSNSDITATFQADPIFLLQKTAISTTSSSATSTTTITTDSSRGGGKSTGLSTGAKIAIGICIPAGVLLVAAALFIYWHRRRKSKAAGSPATENRISELPSDVRGELIGNDPKYGTSELSSDVGIVSGSGRAPLEMSGEGMFELPGDSGTASRRGAA